MDIALVRLAAMVIIDGNGADIDTATGGGGGDCGDDGSLASTMNKVM